MAIDHLSIRSKSLALWLVLNDRNSYSPMLLRVFKVGFSIVVWSLSRVQMLWLTAPFARVKGKIGNLRDFRGISSVLFCG